MKRQIPIILIIARLVLGFIILGFALLKPAYYPKWIVAFLILGLLTDIFDGIIARRLGVATETIRRLDSTIDQIFFITVAIAAYVLCKEFFHTHATKLSILLSVEALTYVVSFFRFRKEIATHSWGAKFWTLTLAATLVQIVLSCEAPVLFEICFWIGVLTRVEIIMIILNLKTWTNDVPTVYHAWKLRQGKEIKRNKLFN